nr:immunoglobulin heavy chain junction region [Mus musculus]
CTGSLYGYDGGLFDYW